jgi:protein involved in polysaccharide export with SLBB domain
LNRFPGRAHGRGIGPALFCGGLLLMLAGRALAQPDRVGASGPTASAPALKYYVWGQVRIPGAYHLGASPDVLELLSAGGGPTEYADLRRVVLVRAVTQERLRVNLVKMLDRGQPVRLSPGDVVIVPQSYWYRLRDGLAVVTSVAVLATLALTIMNGTGR